MRPFILLLVTLLVGCASRAANQDVYLAPEAPRDQTIYAPSDTAPHLSALVEPYIAQARASYPEAKRRFLAGLPPRQSFFVTTRLRDAEGRREQVFVAVDQIRDGQITGRIWNQINHVQGFRYRQTYTFPENDLIDWLITRPDGTEEGNYVGKFMDKLIDERKRGRQP